ncbi:MAG TPA: DUF2157 domain-containing protein [Oculatellaceae cyanobacterium]|jgi:uncharacterized membrane protein
MVSDKFRRQLRQEAELWQAEGLINSDLYEQLTERYQFNALESAARNRFVMVLMGLGSILIGLGIITLVASNWQDLSRETKVTLLLSLFIGVNIAGFYLWRQRDGGKQRFGHGLLILGALILGANMALMGQMFHIGGSLYHLLLAWGVGVLAMAYSLRLTSLGVLSIILVILGYWGFWAEYVEQMWSNSSMTTEFSWATLMGEHLPVLAILMFIPLAYWCRSGVIFGLTVIAIITSLEANLQPFSFRLLDLFSFPATGVISAIAFALPPALLWAYDDSWWVYGDFPKISDLLQSHYQGEVRVGSFQHTARTIAVVCLGILFYFLSSYWFWQALSDIPSSQDKTNLNWFPVIDAVILSVVALGEWFLLLWKSKRHSASADLSVRTSQDLYLTSFVIGIFICIIVAVTIWHINIADISVLATFIFNALLFLLSAGLMREGLGDGNRNAFWGGMVLLTLRIMSWFLLSATGLMLKSVVFILCGCGVIAIGLWFERHVRILSNTHKLTQKIN